jgi:hypothetical protein
VIARIHRLKAMTVDVKAGNAMRNYKLVKSSNPDSLVFQSVKEGKPMRDNNILKRFIKPAAHRVGLSFVNWQCLRTSHATWLRLAPTPNPSKDRCGIPASRQRWTSTRRLSRQRSARLLRSCRIF